MRSETCTRGVVVAQHPLPACPHHWPLLSHSLKQMSQDFKVTKPINCLTSRKKFMVCNALPVKENRKHDLDIGFHLARFFGRGEV